MPLAPSVRTPRLVVCTLQYGVSYIFFCARARERRTGSAVRASERRARGTNRDAIERGARVISVRRETRRDAREDATRRAWKG